MRRILLEVALEDLVVLGRKVERVLGLRRGRC
jgi:hypothetical protein